MNKQSMFLIGLFLVLATLYVAYFTDFLKHKYIQIHWGSTRAGANLVSFSLDKPYSLISLEVVATEEARTNKFPHVLWHLVPANEPVPVSNFVYGAAIPGMKPTVATAVPEPLVPGVDYSILLQAGSLKGEKSFSVH